MMRNVWRNEAFIEWSHKTAVNHNTHVCSCMFSLPFFVCLLFVLFCCLFVRFYFYFICFCFLPSPLNCFFFSAIIGLNAEQNLGYGHYLFLCVNVNMNCCIFCTKMYMACYWNENWSFILRCFEDYLLLSSSISLRPLAPTHASTHVQSHTRARERERARARAHTHTHTHTHTRTHARTHARTHTHTHARTHTHTFQVPHCTM